MSTSAPGLIEVKVPNDIRLGTCDVVVAAICLRCADRPMVGVDDVRRRPNCWPRCIRNKAVEAGAEVIIPSRPARKIRTPPILRPIAPQSAERIFCRLTDFRCIETRYGSLLVNVSAIALVSTIFC